MGAHAAVAQSLCSLSAGGGCAAPEETCLTFGEWADFFVRTCRSWALTLARKPERPTSVVPADLLATWRIISRQQAGKD